MVLGIVAGRVRAHICDGDAQLYRVVARNIVERGEWLDLSGIPSLFPHFREHLPFGFWPMAAVIATVGEPALPFVDGLWTLACLLLVAWSARRIGSTWAAAGAVLVLGTTDPFSMFCAFPRLDGSTAFFATLALVPWLSPTTSVRGALGSATAAAVAVLIKGPFGVVPLVAVVGAKVLTTRTLRPALLGALAAGLAVIPAGAFLLSQRWTDRSWWDAYVGTQLLGSLTGVGRPPESPYPPWWFPFVAVGRIFWPGLAVAPFAWARLARRPDPTPRLLALAWLLGVCLLCAPERKIAHHLVVLFPLAAIFVGEALGPGLAWLWQRARSLDWACRALVLLPLSIWACVAADAVFWVQSGRCVVQSSIGPSILRIPPGEEILLVSPREQQWRNTTALAAERRLAAWHVGHWEDAPRDRAHAVGYALLEAGGPRPPPEWEQLAETEAWSLWGRRDRAR